MVVVIVVIGVYVFGGVGFVEIGGSFFKMFDETYECTDC